MSQPSWPRLVGAGFLVGSACWFREELGLMGLTLAVACYLREHRLSVLAALMAGASIPLAALLTFNELAYQNPLGPHLSGTRNLMILAAPLAVTSSGRSSISRTIRWTSG